MSSWTARPAARWVGIVLGAVVLSGCAASAPQPAEPSGSTSPSPVASPSATTDGLSLVAIGDSIPDTLDSECPGCTGFVERYAAALTDATGKPVTVTNLSQHTGLTVTGLLNRLEDYRDQLSAADAIIVGIAHNSISLSTDKPCGATLDPATFQLSDWSLVDATCARTSAAASRPEFARLYSTIAAWRAGKPTILRTINKYSDWLGWEAAHLTPDQERRTIVQHDAWNTMLCTAATANGFACADIYHAFNGRDGSRPSGALLAADYTHPSDNGNKIIAAVLASQGFAELTGHPIVANGLG